MTTRLFTRCVLIAVVLAAAIAFAPDVLLAKGKSAGPGACGSVVNGARCVTSCNSFNWCRVSRCTDGKLVPSLIFGCYGSMCPAKC